MTQANNSAFPYAAIGSAGDVIHGRGMTLRQYYAGQAMQAIIAGGKIYIQVGPASFPAPPKQRRMTDAEISASAVKQADALIAELEKTNDQR